MRNPVRVTAAIAFLLCAASFTACRHHNPATIAPFPGRTVVVWISMDGVRPDYLDRAATPLFHRLIGEGWYSKQLITIVPSLTFPSHVSEATGVPAAVHGIPANDFYDTATRQ